MFGNFKIDTPQQVRTIAESRAGRVDVADDENISKWAKVLGISEDKLVSSVEMYGSLVTEIRKGIKNESR